MRAPVLTIGITSYKRVNELERCIKSIETRYKEHIEILISEDHSPLSQQIKDKVDFIGQTSEYKIFFHTNETNLGYDMNLGTIIQKSTGKYIFFMSDDDTIYPGFLDELIPFLNQTDEFGVLYAPFVYSDTQKKDRNHKKNHIIDAGEKQAAKYIYDSILFSGLIFRKQYIEGLDASRFKNMNYFQVYMFLNTLLRHKGYYFKNPSVLCVGDGENAYGISESSGGNEILANRKSVKSNLEFNKTLIKTIRIFDGDTGCHIIDSFEKQYSLHTYSGLSIARNEGKKYFKEYYAILNSLDLKLGFVVKVYYVILLLFGTKKANAVLYIFRKILKG